MTISTHVPLSLLAALSHGALLGSPEGSNPSGGFSTGPFIGIRFEYETEIVRAFPTRDGEGTKYTRSTSVVEFLDGGTAIEFVRTEPSRGYYVGGELHEVKWPSPGGDEVRLVEAPDHWLDETPRTSAPDEYLIWYLRELYRLPDIATSLANAHRQEGGALPRTVSFAFEGSSGTVNLRSAESYEPGPGRSPAGAGLPPLSLVRYEGSFEGRVHETRRDVTIAYELGPSTFEIILDESTGLLWSKTARLDYHQGRIPETRLLTVTLAAAEPVTPTEMRALTEAHERFRLFDHLWRSREYDRARALGSSEDPRSPFHAAVTDRLEKLRIEAPLLGDEAPALPWIDVIGVRGESAEERVDVLERMIEGKVVLLDFWATWCAPCIESMPHALELARRYPTDRVVVVFATCLLKSNTREKVDDFAGRGYEDRHGDSFDGIIAILDDADAYRTWISKGIPRYAVIDRGGIVRYQGSGMSATGDAVDVTETLAAEDVEGEEGRAP